MRINTHSMQRWAIRPAVLAGSLMFALAVPGIAIAQGDDENTPGAVGCAITAQLLLLPSGADRYERLLNRTQSCASAAEMEERKLAGELAEVADFDATLQKLAANVRSKFVSLPSKLAPSLVGLESVPALGG